MTSKASGRPKSAIGHARWAFFRTRAAAPRLFLLYCITAALLTLFPAGIALSVRGLINSVNAALTGLPLAETGAYPWLVLGFVMTLGSSVGTAVNRWLVRRFTIDLRQQLQRDILFQNVAMPFARIEQQDYRNGLRHAQNAPETHVANVFAYSLDLATKTLQALSLLLILLAIEPLLLVVLLPLGLPYLLFQWRLSRRQFEDLEARIEKERWLSYYSGLLSDVDQSAEVKLLGLGPELVTRWQRIMAEFRQLQIGYQNFEFTGNLLFGVFSVTAVYLTLAKLVGTSVEGQLTIGDLAIFGSAASQLRGLIEQSVTLLGGLRWELLHVGRLRELLALSPERPPAHGKPAGELRGQIELRDLVFQYPGAPEPTLRGLSFSIAPGETVALVGPNGAGKTTVARLIAGLYHAQQGTILIDGRDVREMDPKELQRRIGCVFQQFGRYMASAADNIAFGDWERLRGDHDAIEAIARRANVHSLITAMPQGYQTPLGRQFGVYEPSGGQWQQLAIARLIARDARIMILDEPTANLDVTAEAALFKQFRQLAAGRTTLLISHRFSTVAMADRILVIDEGRVVENGSHRELLARNGRYAALFGLSQRFAGHPVT